MSIRVENKERFLNIIGTTLDASVVARHTLVSHLPKAILSKSSNLPTTSFPPFPTDV